MIGSVGSGKWLTKSYIRKMENNSLFRGAKLFLFVGDRLAVLLRDDKPGLPDAALWDFPGGGREGMETAQACVLREVREELGIVLADSDLTWVRQYETPLGVSVFFAAYIDAGRVGELSLGDEGQEWRLMYPQDYINHPRAIARFANRLREYMRIRGGSSAL